jgi:hypothetical protein
MIIVPCRLPPADRFYRIRQFDGGNYLHADNWSYLVAHNGLFPSGTNTFFLAKNEDGTYFLEPKANGINLSYLQVQIFK